MLRLDTLVVPNSRIGKICNLNMRNVILSHNYEKNPTMSVNELKMLTNINVFFSCYQNVNNSHITLLSVI